ncbi:MAG: AI-2E family transporter [Bacillota bacterium]|jgi:sporulation integral membrane protein YtvI
MLGDRDTQGLLKLLLKLLIVLTVIVLVVVGYTWFLPILGKIIAFIGIVLVPFLVSWIIAIITKPLVTVLCKRCYLPKTAAVILLMAAVAALIIKATQIIVSYAISCADDFKEIGRQLMSSLEEFLAQAGSNAELTAVLSQGGQLLDGFLQNLVTALIDFAQSIPTFALCLAIIILATFFFCRNDQLPLRLVSKLAPATRRQQVQKAYLYLEKIIGGYARAQLILISISTTLCIVFYLLMGVKGALALGVITGVLDILPMLGPGTLIIPWAIYSLLVDNHLLGISLIIFYIILLAVRNILEPKLVGDRLGLHPLAVLAAVLVGFQLLGVWGLIAGPLALAIALAIYRFKQA